MRNKKNPQVDLERKKPRFFLIGLILAIGGAVSVINLEWAQADITPPDYDPGEEVFVEILPTVTKVNKKKRKPVAKIIDKIIIKDIIPTTEETPEIKLDDVKDPLEGVEFDPDAETEVIDFVPEVEDDAEIVPFYKVESFPAFFDCGEELDRQAQKECFEQGLLKHISSNFQYPAIEREMGLEEKIFVEFIITKKGEVGEVKIIRGNMDGFIKESKRLVKSLPKVKPAKQRGKPVNMKYTIPIKFQLK